VGRDSAGPEKSTTILRITMAALAMLKGAKIMNSRMRRRGIGPCCPDFFLRVAFASVAPAQQKERTLE